MLTIIVGLLTNWTPINLRTAYIDCDNTDNCGTQYRAAPVTSGYATWFTAGGAIRIAHYDVIGDVITRKLETTTDREKRRPPRPMKSSELSNGENRIALRQRLQNRKLRHLWRHNLGSRWKLQKNG